MTRTSSTVIVVDASVLINFLRVDRMDLIARHSHQFLVTDHVAAEVTDFYPDQRTRLDAALQAGALQQVGVDDRREVALFGALAASGRLGAGECSAIASAICRGYTLAMDDRRATRQAREVAPALRLLTTRDLVVTMIRENLLSVAEADALKEAWANHHGFRLPIESFADAIRSLSHRTS